MTLSERFLIPQTIIFTKRFDGGDGGGEGLRRMETTSAHSVVRKGSKKAHFFNKAIQQQVSLFQYSPKFTTVQGSSTNKEFKNSNIFYSRKTAPFLIKSL